MTGEVPEQVKIGVIGGSGLYDMAELTDTRKVSLGTPFGPPSDGLVIGTLRGKRVVFLPRHGVGHVYTPTTVPYRANIYALKMLGVRQVIGVNACGSLKEAIAPGHLVIPDQLVDQTRADRGRSFFDTGLVGHVSVADPFCPELSAILSESVEAAGGIVHHGGSFVIIEGPRFSTRAESHIYRGWGCAIIGMTTVPEAFLAREAEMAYATIAHVTDYDVWHTSEDPVTVERVMQIMKHNVRVVQRALIEAIDRLDPDADWACHHALDHAVMTDRARITPKTRARLHHIIARFDR